MSNSKTLRFRLGLFVILAGVLLAALIVMFGALPTFFKRSTKYTVRFVDAPGLTVGSPVRRSGVRVGEVREITLDEDRGIVIAQLAIDAAVHHPPLGGADAWSWASSAATPSIDLIPKSQDDKEPPDRSVAEPGTEFVGVRAATVNTLLRDASGVVPTTQELLNDIRKSILRVERLAARAEKTMPLVEDTLRDYRDLARQAMPELEKTGCRDPRPDPHGEGGRAPGRADRAGVRAARQGGPRRAAAASRTRPTSSASSPPTSGRPSPS